MTDAIIAAPSLTAAGWITSIEEKADILTAQFYEAEYSQNSSFIEGAVTSLSWIVHQYGNDPLDLTTQLQQRLEAYYSRYFDTANVSASIDTTRYDDADARFAVKLIITVTQAGKEYSLASLIETAGSKVKNIMSINNGA